MNQNVSSEWSKADRIFFRLFFTYLVLYFLFISNVFVENFPFLKYVHAPFEYFSKSLIDFVSRFFLHKKFEGGIDIGGINIRTYIAVITYFILALIITIFWSVLDKRKSYPILFKFLHAYARYYLAFMLLGYGIWKVTGTQMPPPWPESLITPLGNLPPFLLFWNFMGASPSYQFFAGLVEIIPGVFLLFRRTSTLGSLIAVAILVNVFMLNIAYEVSVFLLVIHLIIISFFIISRDLKSLYNIFVMHRTSLVPIVPVVIWQNKYKWIRHGLKISIITYVMFILIKDQRENFNYRFSNPSFYSLHGIYDIKEFFRNNLRIPLVSDSTHWKKMAIDGNGAASIQFMNDYQAFYKLRVDTSTKLMELYDYDDSTTTCKLHYAINKPDEYVFEGTYKNDSIRFISSKIDLTKLPLLENRHKVKWTWSW